MYRHARRPAEQIQILAEINSCSEEKIRDILERNGIKPAGVRKAQHRPTVRKPWAVDELVQFLYLNANGMSVIKLAEYFERTETAIRSIRSKIETRETEPIRVALEIFNREQKRGNTA
jgi:hypothetical protein